MAASQSAKSTSSDAHDSKRNMPDDSVTQSASNTSIEETTGSSEDDDDMEAGLQATDDTASIIGISISKAQSHLKSANTPVIEKMAAIEARGEFFHDRFDVRESSHIEKSHEPPVSQRMDHTEPATAVSIGGSKELSAIDNASAQKLEPGALSLPKLPEPGQANPKTSERSKETSGALGSAFRKRSSSGPEKWMRLPLQMPTLPKTARMLGLSNKSDYNINSKGSRKNSAWQDLAQFDGPTWNRESWNQLVARARGWSGATERVIDSSWSLEPTETPAHPHSTTEAREKQGSEDRTSSRPPLGLRISISDQSLYLARTLSQASSLGDDSRFEHVHEQVNSRFKAMKDSWQDSNIRRNLPNLPKAPSVFGSSKTDLTDRGEAPWGSGPWARRSLMVPQKSVARGLPMPLRALHVTNSNAPSSKALKVAGISTAYPAAHPHFTEALDNLEGDIVVLGGYRGSILREAQAPHRRLWVPLKVGFNLRKVDLEVGFDEEDEERVTEKIIPDGMLTHIGPVDMSKRLFKRLRNCENTRNGMLRVHDYGYDWRLSPHRLSRQLIQFLERLQCNAPDTLKEERGAIVIAHSLGGLITRHAVNLRPELFKGVIFAGVPETCVNILGPLRHGDDVLFSSKVLTAQVNLSIRTSIVLLPLYGRCFVDKDTKEEYLVDFYSVDDWIKYRFSPCTDPALPASPASGKTNGLLGSVSSMIPDSLSNAMPSIPFINRQDSVSNRGNNVSTRDAAVSDIKTKEADAHAEGVPGGGMAIQMGGDGSSSGGTRKQETGNPITGVSIPRDKAIEYLKRTLPQVKRFREELAHNVAYQSQNLYPPLTVIYGKTEPTVCGARVRGRDGIAQTDAYDDLVFASGDGVVLAKAAQLPEGYRAARGGVVASERGHVTLLGDLEAVGKCLNALHRARRKGIGLGPLQESKIDSA
jgi:pimeloyl-ACP methyl ester carboxylesterase